MPIPRVLSPSIGTAFVVLIALICGLALNSLLQLQSLGTQIRTVVEQHNRKIDLITQTQVAAHLRTDSLLRMALTDDPFERDARFMEFNRAGFPGGQRAQGLARDGVYPLRSNAVLMPRRTWSTTFRRFRSGWSICFMTERSADAHRVLVQEAIPIQEAFNRQLADMRNLYQQANLVVQQQAQRILSTHLSAHAGVRRLGDCPGVADRLAHAAEGAPEVAAGARTDGGA